MDAGAGTAASRYMTVFVAWNAKAAPGEPDLLRAGPGAPARGWWARGQR